MLELSRFQLDMIAEGLRSQNDYDSRWLVNRETGETVYWSADFGFDGDESEEDESEDLIQIEPLATRVWYRDMADFAAAVKDEAAARRLDRALEGRGAFRRFKDELYQEYPELLPAWQAFSNARGESRAVEWLVGEGLISQEEADRYLAEHGDPFDNLRAALGTAPVTQLVMEGCVFCSIASGDVEADVVFEDDTVVAFMDVNPITPGHLLVVPRSHAVGLEDLDPDTGSHLWSVGHELARALRSSTLKPDGINLFVCDGEAAFQTVFHFHLHVIPRYAGDGWSVGLETLDRGRDLLGRDAAAIRDAHRRG